MKPTQSFAGTFTLIFCAAVAFSISSCAPVAGTSATSASGPTPTLGALPAGDVSLLASPSLRYPASAVAPTPDPRVGLAPGTMADVGSAIWNLRLLSNSPASPGFTGRGTTGSDIAFTGKYAVLGNYRGFQIWDISNPSRPTLMSGFICPTSQGDPSVYGNLLFISGESTGARNDCGVDPIADSVSMDRFRGVRIFDITDKSHPKIITNVQTCRGSHTHTVVTDPRDKNNIYVYVSGYAGIRSSREVAGCQDGAPGDSAGARFRIDVIQVPLAHPERSRVVNTPHLLADLTGRTVHATPPDTNGRGGAGGAGGAGGRGGAAGGRAGGGGRGGNPPPPGPPGLGQSGCHDITAYPAIGYAGGACGGYGLLFDIRDAKNPKRLLSVADSNMSFWHSATFSNDGTKLLFSDEWGGGSQPRCRATDRLEWGGNALFTLEGGRLHFKSYYKMPAAQTQEENCTAHNGSLIPIPGREVMVQAFYAGGLTVFDWTDAAHPFEMAFFDRGPAVGGSGGYWSVYWYNGVIVASDEGRGMDVFELTPGPYLSQNEIDAARSVRLDYFNAQEQVHFVWPPSFALARAYLDQLERNSGLPAARITSVRNELVNAERASGAARNSALSALATSLSGDIATAGDRGRVQLLVHAVQDMAKTN